MYLQSTLDAELGIPVECIVLQYFECLNIEKCLPSSIKRIKV